MRIETASQGDFAFALEPCAPPVVSVVATKDLTLHVEFSDGIAGEIRFLPTHLTGVFEVLKSSDFFRQVRIEHGAVTWPGELDIAPDAMYDAVKKNGTWVLQ
ncbi:MAG: DUF2442 domain-containing protein [Rhodoferax sp.]|jgi:hypothetical protein|uniref:DUF2442 domain-containing protein n=1 Tax=Rhodoferax sp. TaxID=50421 RepID=UPI003BAF3734|nr:DUF2442 domain-containing protein [Rhodoferax sp.]